MKADSLGDRMKGYYEDRNRFCLTRRTPVIMRLDGRAFHTFTRGCEKPFDAKLVKTMQSVAYNLVMNIQGAKLAYVQSDEISLLITDYDRLESDAWFDYNIQKMVSISASMASVFFVLKFFGQKGNIDLETVKPIEFDSRVFNIPKEEVINYFRWRYQDWLRNSIQMAAQAHFSQKELHGKKKADLHEMLFTKKNINWNDYEPVYKNGTIIKCCDSYPPQVITDFDLGKQEWLDTINKIAEGVTDGELG